MTRLLAIAFALFAVSTAQAQQKTTSAIKTDITNLFPSSGAGLITANQLRQVTNEIADSYANKGGDTFTGLLTLPSLALTGAPGTIALGNQVYAAGGNMRQDWLQTDSVYDPKVLGGLWPASTYAWNVLNKTFTAASITGQGTLYDPLVNGPLATQLKVATNNGATGDVVVDLNFCQVTGANGVCFGGNDVAFLPTGKTGKLVGREIDLEFAAGSTDHGGSIGMPINVFSISSSATAMQLGGVGGGTWANGVISANIRGSHYAINSGDPTVANSFIDTRNAAGFNNTAIVLGTSAAQGINFGGGSFSTSPFLYADSGGNLLIQEGTASNTKISGSSTAFQLQLCSTNVTFAGCAAIGGNSVAPFQVQNPVSLSQTLMNVTSSGGVNALGGFSDNGAAGVSCSAGTVNLSTLVVSHGIVTHC